MKRNCTSSGASNRTKNRHAAYFDPRSMIKLTSAKPPESDTDDLRTFFSGDDSSPKELPILTQDQRARNPFLRSLL
ncbi:hypothetical protein VNO77_42272 [Canavalia gladiata]|uniref:Uncharacterized protein n=1 Tax=Canavalia gladiata TaxID=3824 RepID=A0AAN9K0Q5_CANGL